MAYKAKILADSIILGVSRLTTMEITYPRFVHSELMTHRMFSRNAASSRAIPIEKMISAVKEDPAMPVWWGKHQSGMQAREELSGDELEWAKSGWLRGRDLAVCEVENLMQCGLHKQIANRLLEPWMWITVIVSATDYENFFALRCHPDAQPEIQKIAYMMRDLYYSNTPEALSPGEWHLPLIYDEDRGYIDELLNIEGYDLRKVSVGRCARVSYLTHDGKRDPAKDIELHDRLVNSGHWSPFEHVAQALDGPIQSGNFLGWQQYRKTFENECRSYTPEDVADVID